MLTDPDNAGGPPAEASAGTGAGTRLTQAVAEGVTARLLGSLLASPPAADRTCTALRSQWTGGLLGTRCDVDLRPTPHGLVADGVADHVLALPGADHIVLEATADGEEPLLLLLPIAGPGRLLTPQPVPALDGASFGRLSLKAVPIPAAAVLGSAEQHSHLLRHAVAATRLRLARIMTELSEDSVAMALGHTVERPFSDGRLVDQQAVRHLLAEAITRVRTCQAYLGRAEARLEDCADADASGSGAGCSCPDIGVRAAAYVTDSAPWVVETASRLHGGSGFLANHKIATVYRDTMFTSALIGCERLKETAGFATLSSDTTDRPPRGRRSQGPPEHVAPSPSADDFRSSTRALVRSQIAPHTAEWEERGTLPRSLFAAVGRVGAFGTTAPRDVGGLGLGLAEGIAFFREVMYESSVGVCASLSVQAHTVVPLLVAYGSAAQRQTWLGPVLGGEVVTSVAFTEPEGGSDLVRTVRTVARRDGAEWLLDGEKVFITNAPIADLLIVLARTVPPGSCATALGLTLFLVPTDHPGMTVTPMVTAGLRSSPTGRVRFTACRLPESAVLGRRDLAMAHLAAVLPEERLAIATCALACARQALSRTAAQRSSEPTTRAELARWGVQVEALEAFTDALAEKFPGTDDLLDSALAKTAAARLAQQVLHSCTRLAGPAAFRVGNPASLLPALHDVRIFGLAGGSSETVLDTAAQQILRGPHRPTPPASQEGNPWISAQR